MTKTTRPHGANAVTAYATNPSDGTRCEVQFWSWANDAYRNYMMGAEQIAARFGFTPDWQTEVSIRVH